MVSTLPSQEVSSNKQREGAGGPVSLLQPRATHLPAWEQPQDLLPQSQMAKATKKGCVAPTLKECEVGQWSGMLQSAGTVKGGKLRVVGLAMGLCLAPHSTASLQSWWKTAGTGVASHLSSLEAETRTACKGAGCYQAGTTISHQGLQHTEVGWFPV